MPELYYQLLTIAADIVLFSFVGYYVLKLRAKEKLLEKKEQKMDADYHHVVDDALSKERQILDDATHSADQIITGANYIRKGSQEAVDHAIKHIVEELQKQSQQTAQLLMQSYTESLKQLSAQSTVDFQNTVKGLETDLQAEVKRFHDSLLPNMEKELEAYKKMRMQEAEQMVSKVVQKASQEILNKAIPLEDHQVLMVQALEKAKKEGLFS